MYKDVGMAACQREQKQGVEVVVCKVARMMKQTQRYIAAPSQHLIIIIISFDYERDMNKSI